MATPLRHGANSEHAPQHILRHPHGVNQSEDLCLVTVQLAPILMSVGATEDPFEAVWKRRDEWKDRLSVTIQPATCSTNQVPAATSRDSTSAQLLPALLDASQVVISSSTPPRNRTIGSSAKPTNDPRVPPPHHRRVERTKRSTTKGSCFGASARLVHQTRRSKQKSSNTAFTQQESTSSIDTSCLDDEENTHCSDVSEGVEGGEELFDLLPVVIPMLESIPPTSLVEADVEDDDASSVASQHTVRASIHNILGLSSMLLSRSDQETLTCTNNPDDETGTASNCKCKETLREIHASGQELQHRLLFHRASSENTSPTEKKSSPSRRRRRRPRGSQHPAVPSSICTTKLVSALPPTTTTTTPLTSFSEEIAKCSVLLADDNAINRKLLVHMLHRLGIQQVHAVANGQQVLDAQEDHCYDVILLDIDMPVLSGRACWRELQRRQVPSRVAFVTGHVEERTTEAAADGFLSKPFCMDDVRGLVVSLLSSRARRGDALCKDYAVNFAN